jgi:hypothetical protein
MGFVLGSVIGAFFMVPIVLEKYCDPFFRFLDWLSIGFGSELSDRLGYFRS